MVRQLPANGRGRGYRHLSPGRLVGRCLERGVDRGRIGRSSCATVSGCERSSRVMFHRGFSRGGKSKKTESSPPPTIPSQSINANAVSNALVSDRDKAPLDKREPTRLTRSECRRRIAMVQGASSDERGRIAQTHTVKSPRAGTSTATWAHGRFARSTSPMGVGGDRGHQRASSLFHQEGRSGYVQGKAG